MFEFLSECGGLATALFAPALPAALALSVVGKAAGKAGEYKAVARLPHSERNPVSPSFLYKSMLAVTIEGSSDGTKVNPAFFAMRCMS